MKKIYFILLLSLTIFQSFSQILIVGDTINSNFHNIPDTTLPFIAKGMSVYEVDIDNDLIMDVKFTKSHESSPTYEQITYKVISLNTIQFIGIEGSNYSEVNSLSKNEQLFDSLNWNNSSLLYSSFNSNIPPPWGMESYTRGICIGDSLFIGFRKINSIDTLYGWFHLDMSYFTVLSYATDNDGTFIKQTNFYNRLLIYPNPVINISKLEFENNSNYLTYINVFDISGIKIKCIESFENYTLFNKANFENGIYYYQIEQNGNIIGTGKFIIQK